MIAKKKKEKKEALAVVLVFVCVDFALLLY